MSRLFALLPAILLPLALLGWTAREPNRAHNAEVDFRRQIEPYLKAQCGSCHGETQRTSGFSMATLEGLFRGGSKASPAIIPGSSRKSPLVQYLRGTRSPRMPPGGQASPEMIAQIERWIDQGAKIDGKTPAFDLQEQNAAPIPSRWQPYASPLRHEPPVVQRAEWVRNPIDAFILAQLEKRGIQPAPPADRRTLIRRVCFDLLGLPPTPQQIERFLSDPSPDAYEKLIDRLLDSPHYGEKWARHWLDLARYADTNGYEGDEIRHHAWRYRDYVIRSFNADKPYDRFILEQIAGDELWPDNSDALIATGFLRNGPWDARAFDRAVQRNDFLTDVTDTTASVFLGLTLGCARCHDHKYDPIPTKDYYRFQAFFSHIRMEDRPLPGSNLPAYRAPLAMAVVDAGSRAPEHHLLIRGDIRRPGEVVEPGFPAALTGSNAPAAITPPSGIRSTGRRSALARWLTSPDNPRTARVMVNRLWQYHFGRGLIATPSDFGKNGNRPVHPELLDWLATEFIRQGWSLKRMHRLMMTSHVYRQSTRFDPDAAKRDPENRLLWRHDRRRLQGEEIRDAMLAVSGRLNPKMGGPGVYPPMPKEALETGSTQKWGQSPLEDQLRRTLYVFQRRSLTLPMVEAFDGPDLSATCPRRASTNIAPQVLALWNGAFAREEARHFANRVKREAGGDPAAQVDRAFLFALCRPSTPAEQTRCREFLQRQAALYREKKTPTEAQRLALTDLCHVLLNTSEFLYLD
jgi:hypothetical protein